MLWTTPYALDSHSTSINWKTFWASIVCWHVEGIISSGNLENIEDNYFFQFQNKVFRVSQVSDHEQLVESFGTWQESDNGNKMTVSFPDPDVFYIQMPGLEAYNEFTVTRTSSKEITFTKIDESGTTFAYLLKKQPWRDVSE